ncbi:MAG: beta-Ala-His dipeptidase [Pseudomonadota bacterium]
MTKPQNYPSEPAALWESFYQITQIPRPSKKEEKFRQYILNLAKSRGLTAKKDKAGNVVVYVPATPGHENRPAVIMQSHLDMVCDKLPERDIDFAKDPIDIDVQNGWIVAKGTTLGGDNGFGCAVALGIMQDESAQHPPLELLFTSDEETGLNGAKGIDISLLSGKIMLNLDTEDWGALFIGCAGGIDYQFSSKVIMAAPKKGMDTYRLEITGLSGGHSGCDIHRGRANALKILSEILWDNRHLNFELVDVAAGKAHNIIPRDAFATLRLSLNDLTRLQDYCEKKILLLKGYLPEEDHNLAIIIRVEKKKVKKVLAYKEKVRFLTLLNLFPHGAYSYNWQAAEPVVNMSSNMAVVKLNGGKFHLHTSVRFLDFNETSTIIHKLEALSELFNLKMKEGVGYPSWKPAFNSQLLDLVKDEFRREYGAEPKVKVIHAGLECGILRDKLGDLDVISLGPNLKGAHSPSEALEIDTSNKAWFLVKGILARI